MEIKQNVWSGLKHSVRAYDLVLWQTIAAPRSAKALLATYVGWANQQQPKLLNGFNIKKPGSVAKYAWQLIQNASEDKDAIALIAWGIVLLGWVDAFYSELKRCRLCFCWARPPGQLCIEHTQATAGAGTQAEKFVRYRAAKLVAEEARLNGEKVGMSLAPFGDAALKRRLIGQLMFNNALSIGGARLIHTALLVCPFVLKRVGGKKTLQFPPAQLMELLQEKIDPIEISARGFFLKIFMAEAWYEKLHIVAPGKRGCDRATPKKISMALKLASEGENDTTIARVMGVSRSAVSNWKRRYPEFAQKVKNG
ncbi:MAG: helix-turn-helix domain-containing protein [Burkholderiaceae bacterium]